MFTGIVEALGVIRALEARNSNVIFEIEPPFIGELKVDQSISHNGACLTVIEIRAKTYCVEAIQETLKRTNLGELKVGDAVNLERSMLGQMRVDGHMVQGHVDEVGRVLEIQSLPGSWIFKFSYSQRYAHLLVEKGSICVDGISLTVVDAAKDWFSVAIIPYTWDHTNFQFAKPGTAVNLEYDVIAKYVARNMEAYLARLAVPAR